MYFPFTPTVVNSPTNPGGNDPDVILTFVIPPLSSSFTTTTKGVIAAPPVVVNPPDVTKTGVLPTVIGEK